MKVYHNTTDDYLSDYEPQTEVTDKDFLFLKESKKLKRLIYALEIIYGQAKEKVKEDSVIQVIMEMEIFLIL